MCELLDQIVLILARQMRGPRHCGKALRAMAVGTKQHRSKFRSRGLIRVGYSPNAKSAKGNAGSDCQGAVAHARASLGDSSVAADDIEVASHNIKAASVNARVTSGNAGVAASHTEAGTQNAVPHEGAEAGQDDEERAGQAGDGSAKKAFDVRARIFDALFELPQCETPQEDGRVEAGPALSKQF
jgi:hypothetical protein